MNDADITQQSDPNDHVVTLRIPSGILPDLDRAAFARSRPGALLSRSAAIRLAIEEFVARTLAGE